MLEYSMMSDKFRRKSFYQPARHLTKKDISDRLSFLSYSATGNKLVFVELDLSNLNLSHIDLLEKYTHIQVLKLCQNGITNLHVLGNLPNLVYLDVSANRNNMLLDFSPPPVCLREVNYSKNMISIIPNLSNYWSLTKLELDFNNIRRISSGLSYCKNLNYLSMVGNSIKVIDNVYNLPLRVLILRQNDIAEIKNIETLKYLEVLDLSLNKIKRLTGLQGHYYLRVLKLAENQIKPMSELAILSKLPALRVLDLQHNQICEDRLYKNRVLVAQPSLLVLDRVSLTLEEKVTAISVILPSLDAVATRDRFLNGVYSFLQPLRVRASTSSSRRAPYSLLLIIGPMGSLKTALLTRLVTEFPNFWGRGVLHTTKAPKKNEIPDVDYHFVSVRTFELLQQNGQFIQSTSHYGEHYALSWDTVDQVAKKGLYCASHMELEGALTLKLTHFRLHLILAMSLSEEIHVRRLETVLGVHESVIHESLLRRNMYTTYYHNNPGFFTMFINTDDPEHAFKQLSHFTVNLQNRLFDEREDNTNVLVQWKPALSVKANNDLEAASVEYRQNRAREAFLRAREALLRTRTGKLYPPLGVALDVKLSESDVEIEHSPKSELSVK